MHNRIALVFGGVRALRVIVAIFVIISICIAVVSTPLVAFDESYHYALIQYYSAHLSPFIANQPPELALMGDATRMTSYLSHYVLSIPFRLVTLLNGDMIAHVTVLRLINITFVVGALLLFRRFIHRLTNSGLIANVSVAIYCALPISSAVAAHINYDNAQLLCFAGILIVAQILFKQIASSTVRPVTLFGFLTLLGAGSLIKFTFVPVACIVLLVMTAYALTRRHPIRFSTVSMQRISTVCVAISLIAVTGLVAERYVGNIVKYGSPTPDCASVQSLATCMNYGPWARNYELKQAASTDSAFEPRSILGYFANLWMPLMMKGLGFSLSNDVLLSPPRGVEVLLKVLVGIIGVGVAVGLISKWRDPIVIMIVGVSTVYIVMLFYRNFKEFNELHELVAVQGRYALLLLLPLIGVAVKALSDLHWVRIFRPPMVGMFVVMVLATNPSVIQVLVNHISSTPVVRNPALR